MGTVYCDEEITIKGRLIKFNSTTATIMLDSGFEVEIPSEILGRI